MEIPPFEIPPHLRFILTVADSRSSDLGELLASNLGPLIIPWRIDWIFISDVPESSLLAPAINRRPRNSSFLVNIVTLPAAGRRPPIAPCISSKFPAKSRFVLLAQARVYYISLRHRGKSRYSSTVFFRRLFTCITRHYFLKELHTHRNDKSAINFAGELVSELDLSLALHTWEWLYKNNCIQNANKV